MKKGISISLALLMITATLHFSVATHYCGGKLAASKISLTGKMANCGMESPETRLPLHEIDFSKHCCDDVLIYFTVDNNYFPSFSTALYCIDHKVQNSGNPAKYPVTPVAVSNLIYSDTSPPGFIMYTDVDLSDICIFRI